MIRTLHWYLAKELLRVSAMALVALTLLMTVFGIVEPMRKVGLASNQVLSLFGYLVPVMLSLTLPVAALFAGTIVYGRFSQDNELLAARASGISTPTLLKPAVVLGGVVTVLALGLNNFVAPIMLGRAEQAVKNNIEGIFFHQLRMMNFVNQGGRVIHADEVDQEAHVLRGVVALDDRREGETRIAMASMARVRFDRQGGEAFAIAELRDAMQATSGGGLLPQQRFTPFQVRLPSFAEEDPAWYNWNRLVATLRDPVQNRDIERKFQEIRRDIGNDLFVRRLLGEIQTGRAYEIAVEDGRRYVLQAGAAAETKDGDVELTSQASGDADRPVELKILRGGVVEQTATGASAILRAAYSPYEGQSLVTIRMENVRVDAPGEDANTRTEWSAPVIPVPSEVRRQAEGISFEDVRLRGELLTANSKILKDMVALRGDAIPRLDRKIRAEMHVRMAYCLSCFLLVSLGAALGLMFRGGHFISAFAIALVPGTMLIVLMVMGKEMIRHPDVPDLTGIGCIWGGLVVLAGANALVYLHLVRK